MKMRHTLCSALALCTVLGILTSCTPSTTPQIAPPTTALQPIAPTTTHAPATSTQKIEPPLSTPTSTTAAISSDTPLPEAVATLFATPASVEITYDGQTCQVNETDPLPPGDHVILTHNLSDVKISVYIGRIYPGRSWQEVVDWYATECGPPGSTCRGKDKSVELSWVSWLFFKREATDSQGDIFSLYELNLPSDYAVLVEVFSGGQGTWQCGSFTVLQAP